MGLKSGWLKRVKRCTRCNGIAVLVAAVFIFIDADAWCATQNLRSADSVIIQSILQDRGDYKRSILTAGKKNRGFEKKYQEWQSLTPQEKDTMRHRMNQLNQMPPQDRQHFQGLFDKWQQLSPSERRQIERALDNWDNLSPKERESIRKRFK
jgi:hypothetical protein